MGWETAWREACARVAGAANGIAAGGETARPECGERVGPGVVLLVGASDTGKSTLAAWLTNACLRAGWQVAVVDADVGQSDIGPPGTVGLGFPVGPIERLGQIPARYLGFVGTTSPPRALGEHVVATAEMVYWARETAKAVIVDTTGMVSGFCGQRLKELKIQAVRPDWIIALHQENELAPILRGLQGRAVPRVLRLPVCARARVRSREERRDTRQKSLARYLAGAQPLDLSLERVGFLRSMWVEDLKREVPAERFRHLWVGLADDRGRVLAVGTVLEVSYAAGVMRVLTPWLQAAAVATVILGSMHVAPDGREE